MKKDVQFIVMRGKQNTGKTTTINMFNHQYAWMKYEMSTHETTNETGKHNRGWYKTLRLLDTLIGCIIYERGDNEREIKELFRRVRILLESGKFPSFVICACRPKDSDVFKEFEKEYRKLNLSTEPIYIDTLHIDDKGERIKRAMKNVEQIVYEIKKTMKERFAGLKL